MTVRELLETNAYIVDAQITVRENGHGWLIDQLNIGLDRGRKPPYPTRVPRDKLYMRNMETSNDKWHRDAVYIETPINARDEDKTYFEIKLNRFPKGWLDLDVYNWSTSPASAIGRRYLLNCANGCTECMQIWINAYSSDTVKLKEPKKREEQKLQEEDRQMTIFEIEEGDDNG